MNYLFGFKGTMTRLGFFLVSVLVAPLPMLVFVIAAISVIGVAASSEDAQAVVEAHGLGFALALVGGFVIAFVLSTWMQLAAVAKRSRAVGLGSGFRWAYALFMMIGVFIPLFNIVAYFYLFVAWWMLILKTTVVSDGPDVGAFGERPSRLNDVDLVARAAELRGPVVATPVAAARRSTAPVRKVGRNGRPVFGKR